jgi:hypothetical protein
VKNFFYVFYNNEHSEAYEGGILGVFTAPLTLKVRGRELRKSYKLGISDTIAKFSYEASIELLKVMSSGVKIIKKRITQLQAEEPAAAPAARGARRARSARRARRARRAHE